MQFMAGLRSTRVIRLNLAVEPAGLSVSTALACGCGSRRPRIGSKSSMGQTTGETPFESVEVSQIPWSSASAICGCATFRRRGRYLVRRRSSVTSARWDDGRRRQLCVRMILRGVERRITFWCPSHLLHSPATYSGGCLFCRLAQHRFNRPLRHRA